MMRGVEGLPRAVVSGGPLLLGAWQNAGQLCGWRLQSCRFFSASTGYLGGLKRRVCDTPPVQEGVRVLVCVVSLTGHG